MIFKLRLTDVRFVKYGMKKSTDFQYPVDDAFF